MGKPALPYLLMTLLVCASNILVQYPLNDWLTWGAFPYPITFLVTELTTRSYGPRQARKVVYAGFCCAVLLSFWLATPKIASASCTAFLTAQLLDILLFNRLRSSAWWLGPLCASVCASLLDASIFWPLAFYGEDLPILTWALGDTAAKLAMDFCLLLPFRFAINKVRVCS